MTSSYLKRSIEIYKNKGLINLVKRGIDFVLFPLFTTTISFIRHSYYRIKWDQAAPKPYRLIEIDPQEVEYVLTPYFRPLISRD